MSQCSVVICTHNPRKEFLDRVLHSLREQTLPRSEWELVVIDNASTEPLAGRLDLEWHPRVRVVEEPQLGLTNARLRGIRETSGELTVFVDDDNVLAPDYLERALEISEEHPFLGAWDGRCVPEFVGGEPPGWTRLYWPYLAIHEFSCDMWSNMIHGVTPCGAGLVIRREVAEEYVMRVVQSPLRRYLDRRGNSLISGGDTDLAWTACDLGYGTGRFVRLRLTHLIPAERLTEAYLLRITEAVACSTKLVRSLRETVERERWTVGRRVRRWLRLLLGGMRSREFRFGVAAERGKLLADRLLEEYAGYTQVESPTEDCHGGPKRGGLRYRESNA